MPIIASISKEVGDLYTLTDNAFIREARGGPADRIEVEVGDVHDPNFRPQVKIKRWDNEVNLSVRLQTDELGDVTVSTEGDKIVWCKGDIEANFYEKEPNVLCPEGAYELEVILRKKPKTNKITFSLQSKGLAFHYQPPLTQQELDAGFERPEHIVGSYAVHHESKAGDWSLLGRKNYRAGKAFHIHRSGVRDALGRKIWATLHIDERVESLTITIDQGWLDSAAYPISIDPDFGYEGSGGSTANLLSDVTQYIRGTSYTLSEDGIGASISASLMDWGGGDEILEYALYKTSDDTLVAVTGENTDGAEDGWVTLDIPSPELTAQDYVLAARGEAAVRWQDFSIRFDSVSVTRYFKSGIIASFPDPFDGTIGTASYKYFIYCTYTAAGAERIPRHPAAYAGLMVY